jgi:hypothetical protein
VAAGVETVADLAGLEYRDLGSYSLPQDIRDKLGRVVSDQRGGERGNRKFSEAACVLSRPPDGGWSEPGGGERRRASAGAVEGVYTFLARSRGRPLVKAREGRKGGREGLLATGCLLCCWVLCVEIEGPRGVAVTFCLRGSRKRAILGAVSADPLSGSSGLLSLLGGFYACAWRAPELRLVSSPGPALWRTR